MQGCPRHSTRWLPGLVSGRYGVLDIGRLRRRILGNSSDGLGCTGPNVTTGRASRSGGRSTPASGGRGYATEAGAAAVQYGFEELGEERLFSCIVPDNHRSQAVARRLGFELVEERVILFFPEEPEVHGIWALDMATAAFSR